MSETPDLRLLLACAAACITVAVVLALLAWVLIRRTVAETEQQLRSVDDVSRLSDG